jgi:hypothetical protein
MIHRNFTITAAITRAASLLHALDDLKRGDAELTAAATTPDQRQAASAARACTLALRRKFQRWPSSKVSTLRELLPLGDQAFEPLRILVSQRRSTPSLGRLDARSRDALTARILAE